MSVPGFRKASQGSQGFGGFGHEGPVAGSPFSQAQILHLMKTEFARARRYSYPVSVVLLGVDRLGALVDMHGSQLREVVRKELGKMVQEKTRGADHLGLVSDERYLVVMPHTDEEQATLVATRILKAFKQLEVKIGNSELALTLSIGVASCEDRDTLFFDTMLSRAEVAQGAAADSGGDALVAFAASLVKEPRPLNVKKMPPEPDAG